MTETRNCEIHGEYEILLVMNPFDPDKLMLRVTHCMKCVSERQEAERAEKERLAICERIDNCGIPPLRADYGFDSFPLDAVPSEFKPKAEAVIKGLGRWIEATDKLREAALAGEPANGLWMALVGSMGSGKSGLAYAVAIDACVKNYGVRYFTATGLVSFVWDAKLRGSFGAEAVAYLSNCHVLIIDEIGIKGAGENEAAQLTEVMDGRYRNKLPTLLISNGKIDEVEAALGGRISDRFSELGHWLRCDWPSLRARHKVRAL